MNCGSPPPQFSVEVPSEVSAATEVGSINNRLAIIIIIAAFFRFVISPPKLDIQHAGYSYPFHLFFPYYPHPTLLIPAYHIYGLTVLC